MDVARFKIELEYDGTRYAGWQIQKNARSVQGEIFEALRKVFNTERFEFYGSSRTDTGVHALGQVAHLDVDTCLPAEAVVAEVNTRLPSDIAFIKALSVDRSFHAREHAEARSYIYQISRRPMAFGKRYTWLVTTGLDIKYMQTVCGMFVGFKDFTSFTKDKSGPDKHGEKKSTLVDIERLELKEEGSLILVRIKASHFLWKMVRQIVGVLVEAGKGKLTEQQLSRFFNGKSPEPAKLTAPPSGLFLEKVYYSLGEPLPPLKPCLTQALS
jgi:tRNA pseudouridine38-40 synthase